MQRRSLLEIFYSVNLVLVNIKNNFMLKLKYFSANWCGPCKMTKPIITELGNKFSGVEVEFVDVDENPDEAIKYQVRSIPTIVFERSDLELERLVGSHSKTTYEEVINRYS